jgi:hypothetical protein
MTRKLLALLSPRWRDPSVCDACGGAFTCGATLAGCWCTEVELSAETRASLRGRFRGCLCRACLDRAAAEERERSS